MTSVYPGGTSASAGELDPYILTFEPDSFIESKITILSSTHLKSEISNIAVFQRDDSDADVYVKLPDSYIDSYFNSDTNSVYLEVQPGNEFYGRIVIY